MPDTIRTDTIINELNDLAALGDPESVHKSADDVICALLIDLGYKDVVDAYNLVPKWYA